jgi:phospholipase/lecithinase/hemolysin
MEEDKSMSTHVRTVLLTLLVSVSGNALANNDLVFSGIHAFGTSLSDEGNAFIGCGMQSVPPYENLTEENLYVAPGDSPYARGGHHFSNGSTWVDPLAKSLGVANSALPVLQNPVGTNYAQAGTTAFPEGTPFPLGPLECRVSFGTQIQATIDRGGIPGDALVTVEIGSNDVINVLGFFLFLLQQGDPNAMEKAEEALEIAAGLTALGIKSLIDSGASTLLWANVPDIGLSPAIALLDEQLGGSGLVKSTATGFATIFNAQVEANPDIQSAIADGTIVKLDLFTILQGLVASAPDNGLNVTDTCVTPNEHPFACKNPDDYLFWDGIHPTKAIHSFFSEKATDALGLQ